MPESEPKPKLIELVGPGAGQGWKAVLKSGKAAVVHEMPVPPAESTAAAPRLQRLFDHRHPALSPVLAWGTDQNGVWVAVEPNEGTPLSSILTRGPMTPPAAAALGAAVLSGVAALHETGIAMGGFGATAVRVTSNGEARLAGHPAAAVRGAPSQSDLRADVRSCGMAVCAAFGVDPAGAPAPANIPPGLVVTMRSMASGAMGPSADRALGALREMAAPLLAPDRQMAAQSELATRAGGREVPAITPFLPGGTAAPPPTQTTPAAPAPAAPAPFIQAPRADDQPGIRRSVYEPDDRPLQTYPSIPAVAFPPAAPAPAAPAPAPAAAASAVETPPAASPVPTWAEAPPRSAAPFESPAEAAPPEPPVVETPPALPLPIPEPPAPAPAPAFSSSPPAPAPAFSTSPPAPAPAFSTSPPAPAPAFSTSPPAPAPAFSTSPPAPAPALSTSPPAPTPAFATSPPAPAPAAPAAPPAQTWTPVEAPVWKPGEVVPAEPLGTGYEIEVPKIEPAPPIAAAAPVAPARQTSPPIARKPTVPRPARTGGLGPSERPAWLVPAAVAAVVIVLIGIFGVVVLPRLGGKNPVASTTPSTHPSGSPKSSPTSSPTGRTIQTVPTYAPASAVPVSKIQICTADAPCAIPGGSPENGTACDLGSCRVEVAIYFTAVQKSASIAYTMKFFDRCTGQTTDLPGTKTTTPATGWIVAIPTDHLAVVIPGGVRSGALVAVTSAPAVAASAPLLLGADSC